MGQKFRDEGRVGKGVRALCLMNQVGADDDVSQFAVRQGLRESFHNFRDDLRWAGVEEGQAQWAMQ